MEVITSSVVDPTVYPHLTSIWRVSTNFKDHSMCRNTDEVEQNLSVCLKFVGILMRRGHDYYYVKRGGQE